MISMEPVILQDSPLAQYLEGEGVAEEDLAAPEIPWSHESTSETNSFSPPNPDTAQKKLRKRPPRLKNLKAAPSKNAVASIHQRCSSAIHGSLGWTKNHQFLEQFRYAIVASQLLNDHSNLPIFKHNGLPSPSHQLSKSDLETTFTPSTSGMLLTVLLAFFCAASVRWGYQKSIVTWSWTTKCLVLSVILCGASATYFYVRRQWLHYLRRRALEAADVFISNAQNFDAVTGTGLSLIQDVEIVSRGYSISNPMPPISRLEDASQVKRCARLRRTLRRSLDSMFAPYFQAYEDLRPFAISFDLEKYFDVYEINQTDVEDARVIAQTDLSTLEDFQSLSDLKVGLQKLAAIRKLLLCTLLALDADGGKFDFTTWSFAVDTMNGLSHLTSKVVSVIHNILSEEDEFPLPPTPKLPLTPGKERMRGQMRKLGNLSQGIRSLQAKMRLLREESDKALESSDEALESRTNLLAQYDSIGNDLRQLMHEWDQGRAALAATFARNDHSRSVSCNGISHSRSPTLSLGGTTAFEGSPQEALRALNGSKRLSRSSSGATNSSSGGEIFEAIALPRQRNSMTREERIAKMKENRQRQAEVQEKTQATTHMVRELESVLKLRPRGRTTGRMPSAGISQTNILD